MVCFFCLVAATLLLAYAFYYIFIKQNPEPICQIYAQPGKWFWLKYVFMRLILWRRKKQRNVKQVGMGAKSTASLEEMEKPQKLSEHPKAIDAVFYNASNSDGYFLVLSAARRHNEVTQSTVLMRIPGFGLLGRPIHPDTTCKSTERNTFHAAGLSITLIEPMKLWRLKYSGLLKVLTNEANTEDDLVEVELEIDWTACTDYFNFDGDMNTHAMSTAVALETWSKEFFHRLEETHQTHYEQYGRLQCHLSIKDPKGRISSTPQTIKLVGLRDHSFGKHREWRYFYRYGLQMFQLEDGSCIQAGVVSMPGVTMSRLEIGYIMKADSKLKIAVTSCDLALHKNGEKCEPLDVFEFNFVADGKNYHVKCEVLDKPVFYIGPEWEAKICERMCKFTVNGTKHGYGFSEFQYRNDHGKPN